MFYYLWKKIVTRKFENLQNEILSLEREFSSFSDEEILEKFNSLRYKFKKLEKTELENSLNSCITQVFAMVREVINRKLGLMLFPTQIYGGIVLHYANIAQMNTGEGKTLTALLPVCLNALTGRQVFVITVNEYLAQRDWNLVKTVLDFFEISSGVNLSGLKVEEKKKIYQQLSVVYTTGSALGFDYLRDNLVEAEKDMVIKRSDSGDEIDSEFYYAIIDEVDSILIDEAQNPLIISRNSAEKAGIVEIEYTMATILSNLMVQEEDYILKNDERNLWLTSEGVKKAEIFYRLTDSFFSFKNQRKNFLVHNALKAKHFFRRDVDYIVDQKTKRIIIIDSLTGRLVHNRVYSSGLHQAIESKEKVNITKRSKNIASITYQNFFRLFEKLSGMTGTAEIEAEEFRQIYGMEVIAIKPYKKLIRKDKDDLIFWSKEQKYKNLIKLIKENNSTIKRPILIGSPSVEISENISKMLDKEGIMHDKLNAVNHQKEAEIIARAGQIGAITISTNMAGRGTDIKLSSESVKAGGLLVIGVERNAIRRIDDQLRGRSGRQGDPGESLFFVSLEDDLVSQFFSKEKIKGFVEDQKLSKRPLSGKIWNFFISEPQESIRNVQSSNRRHMLNYDLLISQQRKSIYAYRNALLLKSLTSLVKNYSGIKVVFTLETAGEIKRLLVKEIDKFWSNYLESVEKIRDLLPIKVYLFQDQQEIFFLESMEVFKKGIAAFEKEIEKIIFEKVLALKVRKNRIHQLI
jgi:preprotein translocase subunit SecA